jgi:hypothetical protein
MPHIHWVTRQNKLEIPTEKDEVNKREIRECDGRAHLTNASHCCLLSFTGSGNHRNKRLLFIKDLQMSVVNRKSRCSFSFFSRPPAPSLGKVRVGGKEIEIYVATPSGAA